MWVNRVILNVRRLLPVHPDKQTFLVSVGMSQTCRQQTCPYSITSSARRRRAGGIWMPKDRAVAELMTNSNAVGC